jgi:hypothetical protein
VNIALLLNTVLLSTLCLATACSGQDNVPPAQTDPGVQTRTEGPKEAHNANPDIAPAIGSDYARPLGGTISSANRNCLPKDEFHARYNLVHKDARNRELDLSNDAIVALVALVHGPGDMSKTAIEQKRRCLAVYKGYQTH